MSPPDYRDTESKLQLKLIPSPKVVAARVMSVVRVWLALIWLALIVVTSACVATFIEKPHISGDLAVFVAVAVALAGAVLVLSFLVRKFDRGL